MITVDWEDSEHSIVRIEFTPPWTPEDYALSQLQLRELVEGIPTRLDLINFIHADNGPPPDGMFDVVHQSLRQLPRQFVMIVTVNGGIPAKLLMIQLDQKLLFTEGPFKLHTAESIEAARALIAQDRAFTGNLPVGDDVDSEGAGTSF